VLVKESNLIVYFVALHYLALHYYMGISVAKIKTFNTYLSVFNVKPKHVLTYRSNGIHYRLTPPCFASQGNYAGTLSEYTELVNGVM